jgi:hypothetical protein
MDYIFIKENRIKEQFFRFPASIFVCYESKEKPETHRVCWGGWGIRGMRLGEKNYTSACVVKMQHTQVKEQIYVYRQLGSKTEKKRN